SAPTSQTAIINDLESGPLPDSVKQKLPVWKKCPIDQVPIEHRVSYDKQINGETVYVGRVKNFSNLLPGKIVPSRNQCHGSVGGREYKHSEYEVLTNPHGANLCWVQYAGSGIPDGAVFGGQEWSHDQAYHGMDGETYITRALVDGHWVAGKMHAKQEGLMWYPSRGDERSHTSEFDILVFKI
ncbi:unnamed protein product, partial [Oppiella nova]